MSDLNWFVLDRDSPDSIYDAFAVRSRAYQRLTEMRYEILADFQAGDVLDYRWLTIDAILQDAIARIRKIVTA